MVIREGAWHPVKPWLHLVESDTRLQAGILLPMPGLTFTAWLDGSEMRDLDGLFQQFYDGFKLPDYFGWNFPALNDCLRDLNWLPANQYLLFIEGVDKILPEDPDGVRELISILSRTGAKWPAKRFPDGTERARFQTILASSREQFSNMSQVITNST
ncbi:barstar family protein [Streptomyces sp. NPDC051243]|uniref:barstar family protein n=1 Tax=Streptomyces sp. NPDC051243 TaxID=3365646 RepID=UPI003794AEBF